MQSFFIGTIRIFYIFRAKMHVPSLENIYQTLTKQRDIISRQRIKINHIKSKLGYKDNLNPSKKTSELYDFKLDTIEDTKIIFRSYRNISSLTDSMVSMSLCDQVKLDTERLSTDKLNSLRDMLKTRQILQIVPKRPERTGLSSEIVMEKRRAQGLFELSKLTIEFKTGIFLILRCCVVCRKEKSVNSQSCNNTKIIQRSTDTAINAVGCK